MRSVRTGSAFETDKRGDDALSALQQYAFTGKDSRHAYARSNDGPGLAGSIAKVEGHHAQRHPSRNPTCQAYRRGGLKNDGSEWVASSSAQGTCVCTDHTLAYRGQTASVRR